jgi:hypothetical protein
MRRRTIVTGAGALLAAGLVIGALVGCGSGGSSKATTTSTSTMASPASFADGLCTAVNTYVGSVKSAASTLAAGKVSKGSLQSAADDVETATKTFVSDLKSLGTPETTSKSQAKQSIDQLSSDLSKDAKAIKTAVSGISSPTDLVGVITTVQATALTAKGQITSTVDELKGLEPKSEWQQAFKSSTACKTLASSS